MKYFFPPLTLLALTNLVGIDNYGVYFNGQHLLVFRGDKNYLLLAKALYLKAFFLSVPVWDARSLIISITLLSCHFLTFIELSILSFLKVKS
jgi:hypothetical protein